MDGLRSCGVMVSRVGAGRGELKLMFPSMEMAVDYLLSPSRLRLSVKERRNYSKLTKDERGER